MAGALSPGLSIWKWGSGCYSLWRSKEEVEYVKGTGRDPASRPSSTQDEATHSVAGHMVTVHKIVIPFLYQGSGNV